MSRVQRHKYELYCKTFLYIVNFLIGVELPLNCFFPWDWFFIGFLLHQFFFSFQMWSFNHQKYVCVCGGGVKGLVLWLLCKFYGEISSTLILVFFLFFFNTIRIKSSFKMTLIRKCGKKILKIPCVCQSGELTIGKHMVLQQIFRYEQIIIL